MSLPTTEATAFDRGTAVEPLGDGRYRMRVDGAWWVVRGPNGGYLAAVLARAIRAEAGPGRPLRSLTVHYLSSPREGEAEIAVTVERAGRGLTSVSVRLEQEGRTMATALAALAHDYPGATSYAAAHAPDVPAPEALPPLGDDGPDIPFRRHFEMRHAIGALPFAGGERPVTGGWIRLREDRPLDEPLLVALTDAWWPALFSVVDGPIAAPTIDLTVHLRAALPRPADDVLMLVTSDAARGGFFEEDTRIFGRDGTLLVQSRQLALTL